MKEILLSVVIPVYKVEKFLNECVSSIVQEKRELLEIILVDDGSPDNCPKMCDEWAKKDKRIKVIHKENSGPSKARNKGVGIASGKYITFVDSDDIISDGAMTKVVDYLISCEDFDLCFMNINKFFDKGKILKNSDNITHKIIRNKTKSQVAKYLSTRDKFPGSPCSKIYLKSFLIKNNIIFPQDGRLVEDLGFVLDCIIKAERYDSLDFDYYMYRQQINETRSNKISEKLIAGMELFIRESIEKLCINKKPKDILSKYYLSFVAYEFQILMYFYYKIGKRNTEFLKVNKWLLKFSNSKRGKIINLLANLVGLDLTSKIIVKIKG